MPVSAAEIRIMLNGMPNQTSAMVTDSSDNEGSASQCTDSRTKPRAISTKLTTPYWVANNHFHNAPTTRAGNIQAANSNPRRKCTPGNRWEKNSATTRPNPSWAMTLAPTKISEFAATARNDGSAITSR